MIDRRDFCVSLAGALLLSRRLASLQSDLFTAKIYRSQSGQALPYRLFVPATYDQRQKYPLVLWLHGSAGRGDDNLKQITGGNTPGSHVWTTPENQAKQPCFVV